jgi:arylsulfatase A
MMDRRNFIALLSSTGVAAVHGLSPIDAKAASLNAPAVSETRMSSEQGRPNVVFIICDDLGYGDLRCYGSNLPTPHIDAMAAEGTRFVHYNSAHPICSASRAALLTGRYGQRSNTAGAFGPPFTSAGTSLDETFLSNLFQKNGYKTKAIGKWHLGMDPGYMPTDRGFDSFYGVPWSDDMNPLPLYRDKEILEQNTDRTLLTPRYTAEAVRYIEEQEPGKDPFFLYFAHSYPHDPARASKRFQGKTGFGEYGDSVAEIDWSVGEVLSALHRKGLASNTIVCFTSDHGPWYQGSPGLLRGRKATAFEGGVRVPFIIRWPGVVPAGKTEARWCSALDILPTLAARCGLGLPEKSLDGIDVSSIWTGHGVLPERKPILYFFAMGDSGKDIHCIRKDHWKLRVAQGIKGEIYINDRTYGARGSAWLERPELYNLEQDPTESYDVAKYHPQLVAELSRSLEEQMPSFPAHVVECYEQLKQNKGDISTPPGASPRPYKAPNPSSSWEPEDRRWD